jgi:hypothetical protein
MLYVDNFQIFVFIPKDSWIPDFNGVLLVLGGGTGV